MSKIISLFLLLVLPAWAQPIPNTVSTDDWVNGASMLFSKPNNNQESPYKAYIKSEILNSVYESVHQSRSTGIAPSKSETEEVLEKFNDAVSKYEELQRVSKLNGVRDDYPNAFKVIEGALKLAGIHPIAAKIAAPLEGALKIGEAVSNTSIYTWQKQQTELRLKIQEQHIVLTKNEILARSKHLSINNPIYTELYNRLIGIDSGILINWSKDELDNAILASGKIPKDLADAFRKHLKANTKLQKTDPEFQKFVAFANSNLKEMRSLVIQTALDAENLKILEKLNQKDLEFEANKNAEEAFRNQTILENTYQLSKFACTVIRIAAPNLARELSGVTDAVFQSVTLINNFQTSIAKGLTGFSLGISSAALTGNLLGVLGNLIGAFSGTQQDPSIEILNAIADIKRDLNRFYERMDKRLSAIDENLAQMNQNVLNGFSRLERELKKSNFKLDAIINQIQRMRVALDRIEDNLNTNFKDVYANEYKAILDRCKAKQSSHEYFNNCILPLNSKAITMPTSSPWVLKSASTQGYMEYLNSPTKSANVYSLVEGVFEIANTISPNPIEKSAKLNQAVQSISDNTIPNPALWTVLSSIFRKSLTTQGQLLTNNDATTSDLKELLDRLIASGEGIQETLKNITFINDKTGRKNFNRRLFNKLIHDYENSITNFESTIRSTYDAYKKEKTYGFDLFRKLEPHDTPDISLIQNILPSEMPRCGDMPEEFATLGLPTSVFREIPEDFLQLAVRAPQETRISACYQGKNIEAPTIRRRGESLSCSIFPTAKSVRGAYASFQVAMEFKLNFFLNGIKFKTITIATNEAAFMRNNGDPCRIFDERTRQLIPTWGRQATAENLANTWNEALKNYLFLAPSDREATLNQIALRAKQYEQRNHENRDTYPALGVPKSDLVVENTDAYELLLSEASTANSDFHQFEMQRFIGHLREQIQFAGSPLNTAATAMNSSRRTLEVFVKVLLPTEYAADDRILATFRGNSRLFSASEMLSEFQDGDDGELLLLMTIDRTLNEQFEKFAFGKASATSRLSIAKQKLSEVFDSIKHDKYRGLGFVDHEINELKTLQNSL